MDFYKNDTASFEKLNLTIADLVDGTKESPVRYRFKAYLDESEISYQIMEQSLAYTPLSFVNDKVHTRTTQKVKLKFNVFSEDFEEAQENYDKLHKLLESIKPKFQLIREQYLPDVRNNTGLISVKFKGLPKVSADKYKDDDLVIHLSQFSYEINKELGYIERPISGGGYIGAENRLIPIAYALNIAGQILLPFQETIRLDKKENKTQTNLIETLGWQNSQPSYVIKLIDTYKKTTGNDFEKLNDTFKAETLRLMHELLKNGTTDENGNFKEDPGFTKASKDLRDLENQIETNYDGNPPDDIQQMFEVALAEYESLKDVVDNDKKNYDRTLKRIKGIPVNE
jgi:hypothetical protein